MSNNRLETNQGEMHNDDIDRGLSGQGGEDLAWDGERFIPGMSTEIELEHVHRYVLAAKLATGRRVLDIACGEGYGSYALSGAASSVVGVDISEDAVRHARAEYCNRAVNLRFEVGSAASIPLEDASVDVVVSFETIEHHDQHEEMMREIKRVLVPGGVLIISSPNKYEYSDVTGYANPFHVKELYLDEFETLLRQQFRNVELYGQRVVTGSMLAPLQDTATHLTTIPGADSTSKVEEMGVARPLYFVAIASDVEMPKLDSSVYEAPGGAGAGIGKVQDGRIECKLYWHVAQDETWTERHAIGCYVLANESRQQVRLEIREPNAAHLDIVSLRLDLSDRPCLVRMFDISLVNEDGKPAWSWDGRCEGLDQVHGSFFRKSVQPATLVVTTDDPWLTIPVPHAVLTMIKPGWAVMLDLAASVGMQSVGDSLAEADRDVAALSRSLLDAKKQVTLRDDSIAMIEGQREAVAAERNRLILALQQREVQARRNQEQLAQIYSSTSWRISKPIRFAGRIAHGGEERAAALRSVTRMVYRLAPVPFGAKRRIKGAAFRAFPGLFAHTRAYQDWASLRAHLRSASTVAQADAPAEAVAPANVPASREDSANLTSYVLPVTAVSPDANYQALPPVAPRNVPVRALAFYLPQFHPFPENDEWWGKGFTEWTNVTRAVPQFAGHYQPHLPGELGFYDLRIPEVQRRQVELAKAAGLGGFCFYFYWFGGKRLMEAPIRQYLEHSEFDFPFCLCWANENWTRRWDGLDQERLISQHHSAEDDLAFIEHISSYLKDPRYIRINGRPYLMVYRPNLLPNARETVERWRKWARENGIGELYLAYTQSFENADPRDYGFDAAVEFPPNNAHPPSLANELTFFNDKFAGHVLDWTHYLEKSYNYETPNYRLFRGVTPSWDNEARKPGRGTVFLGSTPRLYEEWLFNAASYTVAKVDNPDERLVFINAWNEWAEGAHLEPDRKYGYAWLQATNNALVRANAVLSGRKIVVVSHDAYAHGAQFLALNLVRTLAADFNFEVATVLLGAGPLRNEFANWSSVYDLKEVDPEGEEARSLVSKLSSRGFDVAICNSTVSGLFAGTLADGGFRCISLVHELQGMLAKYNLERHAKRISESASAIVFPAESVRGSFRTMMPAAEARSRLRPQGLYKRNQLRGDQGRARSALREKLHLPGDAKIVLGVGYADLRKGVDLFARIGVELGSQLKDTYFVWVGHWESKAQEIVDALLVHHPLRDRFVFPGLETDTDVYYAGADVLALTSREDPFPSVVLEALEVGVPVVAFEGATGASELIVRDCGLLVPLEDVKAFTAAVQRLLTEPEEARRMGATGARIIADEFSFRHYVFDLLDLLGIGLKRVSVVVPNFNYARFIEDRLESILKQRYPIYEVIVLDDNSSDDSVSVIKSVLANQSVDNRLIVNATNSGSVFAQWKRGVDLAHGDYVWIAEADDLALPDFLGTTIEGFDDEATVLSYSESKQMAETGEVMAENYRDYVADISTTKWQVDYVNEGIDEIRDALAVKNTIPNVSAVVFKRKALAEVLDSHFAEIRQFRVAGDWMVYLHVLAKGKVAFTESSLNLHRRHGSSVTIGGFGESQLREIRGIQLWVRERFDLDVATEEVADSYARHLCAQFRIDARILDGIKATLPGMTAID
ncbi:Lipopolysaccharide biosynthesis protein [Paraburkholderia steynii]|uniref:Lipopolysaccharide biosynthesis protein n=1 Tax=Paraburkholderia steynii TaxID=1245441 RepID=A0A7Z7FL43_9BURK|nr:glycoside hydrolase family 99-like domain-containing protein [Paraburkholderia steynii]SDJ05690.1 Lipopolysaccharide biosynthesis protein [Paraburkholderia steynii]